jgi:ankyrin repeat protein
MFTPLSRAAQNGHLLVLLSLLRGGADPSLCDEEQHNALHWAVFHRHHVVVRWLLDPAWAPGLQSC